MMARAGTLATKTRRKSGGNAYRYGSRYHLSSHSHLHSSHHHHHHHNHHHSHHHNHHSSHHSGGNKYYRDLKSRRASAPILTPLSPRFVRIPSPISRSAETVALPIPSPTLLASGSSKSVSFSAEVEEFRLPRPDSLSIQASSLTPPPSDKPVYESTVIWAEVEEPDTHYSLVASLCEAGLEASHPCEFIHRGMFILSGSWCVTVFLLVLFALPLVMTTIGVNYLHECPREPKLPIYLVVGGCFGIIKLIFLLWKQIRRHKDEVVDLHDDDDLLTMTRMTNIAVNVFLCVWFVFGHYWLIRIWKPHFKAPLHEPRNWCDETVFHFTFWQLVICHIILAIVLVASIALSCCFVCVKCLIQPELQQSNNENNASATSASPAAAAAKR